MKSFQSPLSTLEEKQYLEQLKNGSEQAKSVLIERNLRLVAHIARKYQGTQEDMEDLISIGTVGLIKQFLLIIWKKAAVLEPNAARCIENELLMLMRSRKKLSGEVSLYEPIGTDKEGNEIRLFDIMESDAKEVDEQISLQDDIGKLYQKVESELSKRERLVLKLRYGLYNEEILTQREIAKQLGISRSYVSRIEKAPLKAPHLFDS